MDKFVGVKSIEIKPNITSHPRRGHFLKMSLHKYSSPPIDLLPFSFPNLMYEFLSLPCVPPIFIRLFLFFFHLNNVSRRFNLQFMKLFITQLPPPCFFLLRPNNLLNDLFDLFSLKTPISTCGILSTISKIFFSLLQRKPLFYMTTCHVFNFTHF